MYIDGLVGVIDHANRAVPLRDYCLGLLMPCERKSVEPMAAVTARLAAQHQSLLHFVGNAPWSDEAILAELYPRVVFLVTNLSRPAKHVVAFYNQRGTAEQHIKEGESV
jgi:SRSO17 transposase